MRQGDQFVLRLGIKMPTRAAQGGKAQRQRSNDGDEPRRSCCTANDARPRLRQEDQGKADLCLQCRLGHGTSTSTTKATSESKGSS